MRQTTMPEGWHVKFEPWSFEDCPTHTWAEYWRDGQEGFDYGVAGWDERAALRHAILGATLHDRNWFAHGRPGHARDCGCDERAEAHQ